MNLLESNTNNLKTVEDLLAAMQEKMVESSEEQKQQLLAFATEANSSTAAIERALSSSLDLTKTTAGSWSQSVLEL